MKKLTKKQKLITSVVGGVLAVALIIAVIAVSVSSCSDKTVYVPRDTISVTLDAGVSVTMDLNTENAVTNATALNPVDSAYAQNLAGKVPFSISFGQLLAKLEGDGKLEGSEDEVLLITIESIKHEDYEKVLEIINKIISEKEYKSKVITLYIRAKETKISEFAEKYGISYGKAYFCNKIAKESKGLDADELASKTIKEIYRLAKEDKNESHVSSVISDLNSSQEEIEPPKDESSSKPTSSDGTSSGGTSSDGTSSGGTSSGGTSSGSTSSGGTSSGGASSGGASSGGASSGGASSGGASSGGASSGGASSDNPSSSGQSFASDKDGSGWIDGWY